MDDAVNIKNKILELVEKYYKVCYKELSYNKVPVSGKVYDDKELKNLVEASLEGGWTAGRWNQIFEQKLTDFLGVRFALTTNSGSSANLVALKTLASPTLRNKRIKKGDEVISVACGFPTTINPIIDVGAIPVIVDVELRTYNPNPRDIKNAITSKTKAVFLPHTMGNPFDLKEICRICKEHNIWLIEDNCDAFGSKYDGKYTGTFGDLSTLSFYPAHHITTGEGGAILTNNPELYKISRSIRDWGRDCWCLPGKDNTCGKRFELQLGKLPKGYDHKYIYSELGYNLKMTDLQAAIGVAQMDKLESFIQKRRYNFQELYNKLKEFEDYFILPKCIKKACPSWFGFLLTIKENKINRSVLLKYLNDKGIDTRLLFAGDITKQPYFINYNIKYKQVGSLKNTAIIMNNTFWIGIYPAITKDMIDYIHKSFANFIKNGGK